MKPSDKMKKFQNSLQDLKSEFETYISNLAIPIEERWETFINAPNDIKNHDHCGPSFQKLPDDFVMYEGPIHAERGNTIVITKMFETIEESIKSIKDESFFGSKWHIKAYKELNINELKEEILSKNCGSFDYDW